MGYQNFYKTTLSQAIDETATVIYLNSLPDPDNGYIVLERESTLKREILYYSSKGANFVTLPSIAEGRGIGETNATSHAAGATATGSVVAEHFKDLANGKDITSVKLDAITPDAWKAYTPTLGAAGGTPSVGNGTITAAFQKIGKSVHYRISLTLGSTTSFGSGQITFSLPLAMHGVYAGAGGSNIPVGQARYLDAGTNAYNGSIFPASATTIKPFSFKNDTTTHDLRTAEVTVTAPFGWGAGDSLHLSGTYETA